MASTIPFSQILLICCLPLTCLAQRFDESFGPKLKGLGWITSIDETQGGEILVAGTFDYLENSESGALLKLTRQGDLASGFNKVFTDQPIEKVFSLKDGKILIYGQFNRVNDQEIHQLARLYSDGTLDEGFAHDVTEVIRAIGIQSDEKIILSTAMDVFVSANTLIRLLPDGQRDNNFIKPTLSINAVASLSIGPDDKIYIQDSQAIQRLNANGTTDTAFQKFIATDGQIFAVTALSDGAIMIGGGFKKYGSQNATGLIKVDALGNFIQSFPGPDFTLSITELSDGKIMTGGNDGVVHLFDANATSYEPVITNFFGSILDVMETSDHKLLVSRWFGFDNGFDLPSLMLLDEPMAVNEQFDPNIFSAPQSSRNTLALLPNGDILLGGYEFSFKTVGDQQGRFFKFKPDGSVDPTFNPPFLDGTQIISLEVSNNKILVSGFLQLQDGFTNLIRLNADGSLDELFEANFVTNFLANRIRFRGTEILLGGNFDNFNGVPSKCFVILDYKGNIKQTFNDLPPISDIQDFEIQSDGRIVAIGTFQYPEGLRWMIRLNPDGTTDTTFKPQLENPASMTIDAQDRIYVGGSFLDGLIIKRFTPSGKLDLTFNPGDLQPSFFSSVSLVSILPTQQLAIGGNFKTFNGNPVGGFIILDKEGSGFSTPKPLLSTASNIQQMKYYGSNLYLGGKLTFEDGKKVIGLGKLKLDKNDMATPKPPAEFRVISEGESMVDLGWQDVTDSEDAYEIEILETPEDAFVEVTATVANIDAVIDSVSQQTEAANYRIRAVNAKGASRYVYLKSGGSLPPDAPSNFSANLVEEKDIKLIWTDNSSSEHGFLIERARDNELEYEDLMSTRVNATEFIDTDLKSGHTYYYRISAFNADGYSGTSTASANIVTGLAPRPEPLFTFYPNPVSNLLSISTSSAPISIQLINQVGQIVINIKSEDTNAETDLSPLPNGVYIIRVTTSSKSETQLLIKK
ncbi:MAG: T9SS type A sorting domain-containing protein [Cyclobacteriaceae bacterium]